MKDDLRLKTHPLFDVSPDGCNRVTITVEGQAVEALEGELLAAALWVNGFIALGRNPADGSHRGMYCGVGHCYECRVTVDGAEDLRSCLIRVRDGMQVSLQKFAT